MNVIQLAGIIIGSIVSVGILIAGTGYAWGQFYKGRDEKTKEDYSLLKTRLETLQGVCDQQQEDLDNHQEDIKSLRQEIGKLQGINEEKEKKIKELTEILSNRDPQLSEFIKFSKESNEYFRTIVVNLVKDITEIKHTLNNKPMG